MARRDTRQAPAPVVNNAPDDAVFADLEAEGKGEFPHGPGEGVPVYVLRADMAGHLAALLAVRDGRPADAMVTETIREFELWESRHR